MHAAQHKLDSITVIVDYNQMQASGTSDLIVSLSPLREKFTSFGFDVSEVNGHDILDLVVNFVSGLVCGFPFKKKPRLCVHTRRNGER